MVKNATPGRTEWPASPQKVRRRRDSKVTYYNNPKFIHRNVSGPSNSASPSGSSSSSRPNIKIHQQSPAELLKEEEFSNFFDFQSSAAGPAYFDHGQPQHNHADTSWLASSMNSSYTLPSRPPNSPQPIGNGSSTPNNAPLMYDNALQSSWQTMTPIAGNFISDPDAMSDSQFGSFESLNSLALTINTEASSISDSFACPESGSSFESPGASNLSDLYLPDGYFHTRHQLDTSPSTSGNPNSPQYADLFRFENDYMTTEWTGGHVYSTEHGQWSSATVTEIQSNNTRKYSENTPTPARSPWNSQSAQENGFGADVATGCVAFEPPRGVPYDTFRIREEYLQANQGVPEVVSPAWDGESEGWHVISSYPSSTIRSHDSPLSLDSPWSHVGSPPPSSSPPPHQGDTHSHVFSAYPGEPKSTPARGRQRALTSQEKQEALIVRKAKACWACHLSKIKCSPCSPGSPCQQCERLAGKRRFCWLPCFNDPLESLQTFMAPQYRYGDFSMAKVESCVSENATSWGSHEMLVRMRWGYWQPLEETVVTLTMRHDSKLAFQHQSLWMDKPTLMKKKSPPLGVPLAAMDDMQSRYRTIVQQIVTDDLKNYVYVPYSGQNSMLPERLLETVANFYSAALAAGDKSEMLRQALEIHVTSTVLQRSLILDEDSLRRVEIHLQQQYPRRSAARLAQRQIKLAFYEIQRSYISKVLGDWGKEMWTSNKNQLPEKKWAITFSVLLVLILVTDKILASSYSFCEAQIKHHGADPRTERAKFRDLVRLTEKELFDRCKEIFHTSFKTRKAGKEAYNPIRDGQGAFRGKPVNEGIFRFVRDLEAVMREFDSEIRSHKSVRADASKDEPYTNAGRLASVFLADFLDH